MTFFGGKGEILGGFLKFVGIVAQGCGGFLCPDAVARLLGLSDLQGFPGVAGIFL